MSSQPQPGELASAGLSRRLAEFVCGLRYEQVAPSAIEQAKHHLVHHLGLAIGSRSTEAGQQAVRLARLMTGAAAGPVVRNGLLAALLAREGGQAARTVLEGRFGFFRTFFGQRADPRRRGSRDGGAGAGPPHAGTPGCASRRPTAASWARNGTTTRSLARNGCPG